MLLHEQPRCSEIHASSSIYIFIYVCIAPVSYSSSMYHTNGFTKQLKWLVDWFPLKLFSGLLFICVFLEQGTGGRQNACVLGHRSTRTFSVSLLSEKFNLQRCKCVKQTTRKLVPWRVRGADSFHLRAVQPNLRRWVSYNRREQKSSIKMTFLALVLCLSVMGKKSIAGAHPKDASPDGSVALLRAIRSPRQTAR